MKNATSPASVNTDGRTPSARTSCPQSLSLSSILRETRPLCFTLQNDRLFRPTKCRPDAEDGVSPAARRFVLLCLNDDHSPSLPLLGYLDTDRLALLDLIYSLDPELAAQISTFEHTQYSRSWDHLSVTSLKILNYQRHLPLLHQRRPSYNSPYLGFPSNQTTLVTVSMMASSFGSTDWTW